MNAGTLAAVAIFLPIAGAGIIAALGRRLPRSRDAVALGSGGLAAGLSVLLLFFLSPTPIRVADWIPALGIPLDVRLDALGAFIAAIAGVLGFVVVVYSRGYMARVEQEGYSRARYDALVLLFIGAMIGLALSDTLLAFYVFWEIVGLCSFALISYYHRDPAARRAGLKAFAVTRVGDIGLLITIVLLWSSDIVTFTGLEAAGVPAGLLHVAALGVLLAAMGKSAQVPLHVWLPDAMEAPTPVSALIHAATMVNAGIYLLARTFPAFESVDWWTAALLWIGASSAVLGAVAALTERDLKRVLAYSTISQLGYMVAAIGAGAILASQFHLLSQAIFKALLFLAAGAVIQAAGTRDLLRMGGLRRSMPLTSGGFLVGTIAMIGLPLANGFWSKDLLLNAVYEDGHIAPFVLLVLVAFLTTAYAWRAYDLAFRGESLTPAKDPHASMGWPIAVLAGAAATSGFLLGSYSEAMAATMPAHGVVPISVVQALTLFARLPSAVIVVGVIAVSAVLLSRRDWVAKIQIDERSWYGRLVGSGFLVDAAFRRAADRIRATSAALRKTQTGDLNLNLAALLAGLLAVLAVLLLEAIR